jgi:hypothetical protein
MSMPAFSTEQFSDVAGLLGEEQDLEARLLSRFSQLHPDQVRRCLGDAMAQFEGARVRNFLAVLIERAATDRLRVLEREAGGLSGLRRRGRRGGAVVSGRAPA